MDVIPNSYFPNEDLIERAIRPSKQNDSLGSQPEIIVITIIIIIVDRPCWVASPYHHLLPATSRVQAPAESGTGRIQKRAESKHEQNQEQAESRRKQKPGTSNANCTHNQCKCNS